MPAIRSAVLAILLSLSSFVSISAAQPPLHGTVQDPDGRPVPGALIVAMCGTSAPLSTKTDDAGRFELTGVPMGPCDVIASTPGLHGEARTLISDAPSGSLDITLRISALTESLVVSASQIDQPLSRTADSVTVISGQELEARQATTLAEALQVVPGFTVAAAGGPGTVTSLFPRGGESDFALVLVDGVRANAFGGGIDLSQVPLADVERIEIVRGPQSAIFGADAIGGVVQIVTRQGGTPAVAGRVEGGSRATRRLQASTTGERGAFRWQAGGDYFNEDGFTGLAPATGERVDNDDAMEAQGWVGLGWRSRRGTDLQGTFRYVETERGAPGPFGSDPAGSFTGVDRIARGGTERRSAALRVVHPWTGPASRVRQRIDIDIADYDLSFLSAFGASASETRRTHARVQTDASVSASVGLSAGFEWLDESGRSSFIRTADAEVPVERRILGLFGEGRWQAHDRLSLQAGLRTEHITREAFVVNEFADDRVVSVNPKLSLSWVVSPSLPGTSRAWTRIHAAAGTGIRPPDMFEIAFTDNPALKPERSRSVEIGVTQALAGGAVHLDATAFLNEFDDLIVSVGSLRDVSRYRTDNVSNARARGLELGGGWQGPAGLAVRASYTLLDTAILAVDGTAQAPSPYEVGDPLLRRPRHRGAATFTWSPPRATLFATVDTRGRVLDAEPSMGPAGGLFFNPGRTVVDAGGAFRLVRGVELFGRVTNLLDRRYEEVIGFPAPERSLFAGVRIAAGR